MKKNDEDMSEENDSKLNLDKDDEDLSDSIEKEVESTGDKAPKSPSWAPRIHPKKSPKFSDFLNPFFSLLGKHERDFDSEESSDGEQREKKKKIKELTTFQKSYIQSEVESFQKNYEILKDDFKLLEEYEIKIFKDTNLDIMFIMDLTGSMGIWLNEAKKSINNIIEEITDNNPGAKIRMSFVGYRDFLDEGEQRKYDNQEFTENLNEFNIFLSKLDCSGGADEPEDIVGAMRQALNMDWMSNAKYAVLVADAPCHGKEYHNISYDRFSNGDPDGVTLEDVTKKFYDKGITFYCIEINDSTKKMFKIMEKIYNDKTKFHVEKLGNSVHQFSFFVAFSASVLLGNAKYNKMKFNDILINYRNEIIEKIMKKYMNNNNNNINGDSLTLQLISQIESLNLGGEDKKLFDFINRMGDLNINKQNSNENLTNISMPNNDFINNDDYFYTNINEEEIKSINTKEIDYNIRALFYNKNPNTVNDWLNPTIEEKIFTSKLNISFSSIKKDDNNKLYEITFFDKMLDKEKKGKISFYTKKALYNNPSQYIKKIAYDDLICEQIADYFNVLMEINIPYLKQFIKFQRHILYELNNHNSLNEYYLKNKYIISEDSTSIQLGTAIIPNEANLQSFSHFSYQITGGELLITDIKYDKELKKAIEYKIYFLKENGYKKFLEFFASHICNNTCKVLGLAHPRKKLHPIEVQESFFSNRYLNDINICICCSVPFHKKKSKEQNSLNCGFCSWKESRTKINTNCSQCQSPFSYSTYVYNCKLINYPTKCEKCSSKF